eukprot:XP_001689478.1 predicted protein [Chlamydomonas reinhardtii]
MAEKRHRGLHQRWCARSRCQEVDSVLSALLQALRDAACKGRLVGYLTADRVLARFTAAACRLDLALARLQDETRGGPPRARFALPPAHGHTLGRYRAAADGLAANWGVLLEACGGVLQATLQAPLLSRRVFEEALSELQAEAQLQQYEPVLLHDTGHSYDRSALEGWWAAGHRFCPRTGVPLRRLNTSPNHNLRSAIERWQLHCEMQLSFRPVIDTLDSLP